tara:strand:+ start:923 stop:2428 length:1506 start_codon:yes stop_codon:yes gene_type:complete
MTPIQQLSKVTLGLATLFLASASLAAAQDGPSVGLEWRSSKFANRLWIVDKLAGGEEGVPDEAYVQAWTKVNPFSPQDRQHLQRYLVIRQRIADTKAAPEGPELLTHEPTPGERFLLAGLAASSSRDFANRLRLKPEEGKAIDKTFTHFRARLNKFIEKAEYLSGAHQQLQSLSDKVKLKSYLGRAAEFFGSRDRVQGPLAVDIVFAPEGTRPPVVLVGSHIVLPCTPETASSESQPHTLAAVVHEACHFFVSRLSRKTRVAVLGKTVARLGVINPSHPNVLEEATCTAIGNMAFLRESFPKAPLPNLFHPYEPTAEHPHAIDTLARRLEFAANRGLGKAKSFEGNFLTQALATQSQLLPARPRHFSRLARVFWGSPTYREIFIGMFGDHFRHDFEGEKGLLEALSDEAANDTKARWFVLSLADLETHQNLARELASLKDKIKKGIKSNNSPACVATRRRPNGGLDLYVIGADAAGVRLGLIHAQGLEKLPSEEPVFLPEQ